MLDSLVVFLDIYIHGMFVSVKFTLLSDFGSFPQKLRVWCRQPRGKWELGSIKSTSGEEASVSLSNGNVSFYPFCACLWKIVCNLEYAR